MEENLIRLMLEYTSKGMLPDKAYIDKLVEIVVCSKDLNDYVKSVSFEYGVNSFDDGVSIASYNPLSSKIKVNVDGINIALENYEVYECLFEYYERILFRIMFITQAVLHELEHAYQCKISMTGADNSVFTKLIKASNYLAIALKNPKFINSLAKNNINIEAILAYCHINRTEYERNYIFDPMERTAEIYSYSTICESMKLIKDKFANLNEYCIASLYQKMLRGYEESWSFGLCPSQVYLFNMNKGNVWQEMPFYDENYLELIENAKRDHNFNSRLLLGLPVESEEYYQTKDYMMTLNKFNI